MLKRLAIKNFAIIEDIEISFNNGLTVLTGETGAGKSLLIDSISLLLGERANTEMIRTGFDKAYITGHFTSENIYLNSLLEANNIKKNDDDEIIITRIIEPNKSTAKINGVNVSLNELKKITRFLADIHLQFDMTKLFDNANYIDIIDGLNYEVVNEYKNKYLSSLEELKQIEKEYLSLIHKHEEMLKRKEEYENILKEIDSYNLIVGEEKDIEERISFLTNYDTIFNLLNENKEIINKDGLDDIYVIKENLRKLSEFQNEYKEEFTRLDEYYYQIEEIYHNLKNKLDYLDYDPSEINSLNERMNDLNSLKRKYGRTIEEIIAYKEEIKNNLDNEENYDYILTKTKEKFIDSYQRSYEFAKDLSLVRKEIAKKMEKELSHHLADLELKSRFEVIINSSPKDLDKLDTSIFKDNGIDEIEFMIETNVGEGLKTLSKIVSGGEASRIALAIKMLFVKSQNISTIIFDEVDTGVSGIIARKVGLKLYELSLNRQVIIITHLPQVASLSNTHIKISKKVEKGRTFTLVKELNLDEKIVEVASLLGDGELSPTQIEYAKELINNKNL